MSKLKSFLNRRSEGLKTKKKGALKSTSDKKTAKNPNLTDEQFWAILQDLQIQMKDSKEPPIQILEKILAAYSDKQVEQFSEKYSHLNS